MAKNCSRNRGRERLHVDEVHVVGGEYLAHVGAQSEEHLVVRRTLSVDRLEFDRDVGVALGTSPPGRTRTEEECEPNWILTQNSLKFPNRKRTVDVGRLGAFHRFELRTRDT